ncbi:OmpW/AlkL family protein [Microbulbifer magnicolonia]|uniref:OmpW/AlkL family protein n=1 Tax=Microbulbifer magnicolonia TaxID=3109744 RepID=UPI002B4099F0|nr:OmpW family outer membrane protein [Microbulbifer sp. GG15]
MKPMRFFAAFFFSFLIAPPPLASAQQDWREMDWGDFIVRLGGSYIHPDDESTSLKFRVLQHWDLYNTSWEIDTATTWQISGVWRPMEQWGVELLHINGAEYDVDLDYFTGTPGRELIELGDFKATSTLAFANWYMLDDTCLGRPYLGVGINYTDFHDVSLSGEFSDFLINSGLATGRGNFNLGHSWDWAVQAGVDLSFGRNSPLLINAAVLYFLSDTDATVTFPTELGQNRLYAQFDYDPWIVNLSFGFKF